MLEIKLEKLSNKELLQLYEDFVKWRHYEATDEFRWLREMDVTYYDVRKELENRMK